LKHRDEQIKDLTRAPAGKHARIDKLEKLLGALGERISVMEDPAKKDAAR